VNGQATLVLVRTGHTISRPTRLASTTNEASHGVVASRALIVAVVNVQSALVSVCARLTDQCVPSRAGSAGKGASIVDACHQRITVVSEKCALIHIAATIVFAVASIAR